MIFLHELPDSKQLFEAIAKEKKILPVIIEKDYWLMHCLWGLQQQNYEFELKGGTSLSKGFGIIERFSEDVDIQLHPDKALNIKTGKNHNKPAHISARKGFFDSVSKKLKTPNLEFSRDHNFDDTKKMRGAGIRGEYQSHFSSLPALKPAILLELGFDQTTPNLLCDISSWALDKALSLNIKVINNQARQVKCYCPEYTFVEKLQTISTKFRLQQENKKMPVNFLRHYYDVYKLLENQRVLDFIGTEDYQAHKQTRFRMADEADLTKNEAFIISDNATRTQYALEFQKKSAIYFGQQPLFDDILKRIKYHIRLL
jgi:hypothetical protein